MASAETRKLVLAAAAVCEDKKGEDTRVLELDPADSSFTDFFLITSGANTRQTEAIAEEIELKLKREFNTYAHSVEGRRTGEWILLDYIDFVVHIFLAEKRAFYDIERLRKSARPVDVQQLEAALTEKTVEVRSRAAKAPTKKAAVRKAPSKKVPAKKAISARAKKAPAKAAPAKATRKTTRKPKTSSEASTASS